MISPPGPSVLCSHLQSCPVAWKDCQVATVGACSMDPIKTRRKSHMRAHASSAPQRAPSHRTLCFRVIACRCHCWCKTSGDHHLCCASSPSRPCALCTKASGSLRCTFSWWRASAPDMIPLCQVLHDFLVTRCHNVGNQKRLQVPE